MLLLSSLLQIKPQGKGGRKDEGNVYEVKESLRMGRGAPWGPPGGSAG